MRSLYTTIITEANIADKVQRFATDLKNALDWFETRGYIGGTKNIGLTKSDIELIYDYAISHKMPCPIVVNYRGNSKHFVFRRWVSRLSDEVDGFDFYKTKAPYQGLHDTAMKEDGSFFPSAEDFEYIIAYSHNKNALNTMDDDNIQHVFKKEKEPGSKIEQLILYFDQNKDNLTNMVTPLKGINSKLAKLPTEATTTKEWFDLGEYNRYGRQPNKTPKTDIISENGKWKISVKKYGGSELMSGKECETRATIMNCLDELKSEEDVNLIKSIFVDGWYNPEKDGRTISEKRKAGDKKLLAADKILKEHNKILKDVIDRNPAFKRAIMYEAATGNYKFGKNSPNAANYVYVWDDLKNNSALYTVDQYVDHVLPSAKFDISFKTARSSSMVVLRIVTK